ncbi:MAG: hypothetical protein ACI4LK_02425 [Lentihominibacter sp.]
MKITCCKGCEKRFPGCRSECEEYLEERRKLDEYNEEKYRELRKAASDET